MKVPCWVCKGSGELEPEEYIDFGTVVPPIYCDWCDDDGMIEIGSEKHKKYSKYLLLAPELTDLDRQLCGGGGR